MKFNFTDFSELEHHKSINKNLERLSTAKNLPHIIIYGPPGSGKTTRIMCLLKKMYGSNVFVTKNTTTTINGVSVVSVSSSNHIEVDLSTIDPSIVYEYLKTMSSGTSVLGSSVIKTLFIKNADELNRQSQSGLRRTMENCSSSCIIILECRHYDKIISPLSSRCISFRIPSPIKTHDGNLKKLNLGIDIYDWEIHVKSICESIFISQDPRRLYLARESIQDLLSSKVPAYVVIFCMEKYILDMIDNMMYGDDDIKSAKIEIVKYCSSCENRIQVGINDIVHIEAFLARCMKIIKNIYVDL